MAWDKTKPADNEKLKDIAALIRANWEAIEALTDAALQITNAKIAAGAAIADTKLAQITTAGKVSGSALTGLASIPSGAGLLPVANIDHGTTANKILKLDASAKIPAVDGSQLTHLNGSAIDSGTVPAANVETGTTANKILKLDANAKIPAVDGSQLTNLAKTAGEVVQVVITMDGTQKSGTGVFPTDNTKPQNTEGWAYAELDTTITPKSADNILLIEFNIQFTCDGGNGGGHGVGLFKDSDADAIYASFSREGNQSSDYKMNLPQVGCYKMVAGGTSPITFKVRLSNSMTGYLNTDGGAYTYGDIMQSMLKVTEIKA